MNCNDFETLVCDLASGIFLEAAKHKLALAHKNSCPRCAARLTEQRSLTQALRATAEAETEAAPTHIKAALLQAFAERTPAPTALPPPLKTAAGFLDRPALREPNGSRRGAVPPPADRRRLSTPRPRAALFSRWAIAAVLLVGIGIGMWSLLQNRSTQIPGRATVEQEGPGQPSSSSRGDETAPPDGPQPGRSSEMAVPEGTGAGNRETAHLAHRHDKISRSGKTLAAAAQDVSREATTEYIPLTYVSDATAIESGHVVRMMVPRTTLISLGVPMSAERGGGAVKADVVLGDDGVARAIRFVYPIAVAKDQ